MHLLSSNKCYSLITVLQTIKVRKGTLSKVCFLIFSAWLPYEYAIHSLCQTSSHRKEIIPFSQIYSFIIFFFNKIKKKCVHYVKSLQFG